MAKIGIVVRKNSLDKNGMCKVQFAVRHGAGNTAYIPTEIKCKPEWFKNGMLTKACPNYIALNNQLSDKLNAYEDALKGIRRIDIYSVQQIKDMLMNVNRENKTITFNEWCDVTEEEFIKEGKQSTANVRKATRARFNEYMKGDICLRDLTPTLVKGFKKWLDNAKKDKQEKYKVIVPRSDGRGALLQWKIKNVKVKAYSEGTIGQTLRTFRAIVNSAIKRNVVKYHQNPVEDMRIKESPVRHVEIVATDFNKLVNYVPGEDVGEGRRVVVDILLMSFYLGGVNLQDLFEIKFNLNDIRFCYERKKSRERTTSRQIIELPLFPVAKNIIKKYIGKDNRIYLPKEYNFDANSINGWINRRLKRIAVELDIDSCLCYNTARKSFSAYASKLGCEQLTINYILGHADNRGRGMEVMKYYTENTFEQSFLCMKKVFDYVANPQLHETEMHKLMMQELSKEV